MEVILREHEIPADLLEFFEPIYPGAKKDVFTMATRPYPGSHFATFPPELPETCIRAGTSARGVCPACGTPWERGGKTHTTGWESTCSCNVGELIPATVLDPFNGSGTTGRAALALGRSYIGVDISEQYLTELSPDRLSNIQMEMAL